MNYVKVRSSNVKAVGYNPETTTLGVQYLNDTEYYYYNVPIEHYDAALRAPSVGSYLHQHIKKGQYKCKQIR